MNRVEHQNLNQTTAVLSFVPVFGVQLGLRQRQALIKTKTIRRGRVLPDTLLSLNTCSLPFFCLALLAFRKWFATALLSLGARLGSPPHHFYGGPTGSTLPAMCQVEHQKLNQVAGELERASHPEQKI